MRAVIGNRALEKAGAEETTVGRFEKDLKENEIRLKLFIMAYNLGNIFRTLALPEKIRSWSLRTIQLKLIKIGGRLIRHARYYYLLLAEATINERIRKNIMRKINGLCPAPG